MAEIGEWIKENSLTIYCLEETLQIQGHKQLKDIDCKKTDAKRYIKQKATIRWLKLLYQYYATQTIKQNKKITKDRGTFYNDK